jgi:DNA-binding CsgD family transcriptional regulator
MDAVTNGEKPVELLARTLLGIRALGVRNRGIVSDLLRDTLDAKSDSLAAWVAWEPNSFDECDRAFRHAPGHDAEGRLVPYWHRAKGVVELEPLHGYDKPGKGDWYSFVRRHGQLCVISEPMLYPIAGKLHWITSEMAPLLDQGVFLGTVGLDWAATPTQRPDPAIAITRVHPGHAVQLNRLTAREREVHHWICQGKSNDEIGVILGISANTVKNHLSTIFQKLGVESRYAAALLRE